MSLLKKELEQQIPVVQKEIKKLIAEKGEKIINKGSDKIMDDLNEATR